VSAEQTAAEREWLPFSFQIVVAEADKDCEGDNSGRSERTEQRSNMRDAGEQRAIESQDRGKEVETSKEMAGEVKKRSWPRKAALSQDAVVIKRQNLLRFYLRRRARRTVVVPATSVIPLIARAGSISGARGGGSRRCSGS